MTELFLLKTAAFLAAGMALGMLHFLGLRTNIGLYLGGAGAHWRGVALQAGRLAVTAAAFAGIAQAGAVPLLAAAAGFLVGRMLVIRNTARAS